MSSSVGLKSVDTTALKRLLAAVHKEQVRFPLDVGELARVGVQYCSQEILNGLRGLDGKGVRAVLVAVLAERL